MADAEIVLKIKTAADLKAVQEAVAKFQELIDKGASFKDASQSFDSVSKAAESTADSISKVTQAVAQASAAQQKVGTGFTKDYSPQSEAVYSAILKSADALKVKIGLMQAAGAAEEKLIQSQVELQNLEASLATQEAQKIANLIKEREEKEKIVALTPEQEKLKKLVEEEAAAKEHLASVEEKINQIRASTGNAVDRVKYIQEELTAAKGRAAVLNETNKQNATPDSLSAEAAALRQVLSYRRQLAQEERLATGSLKFNADLAQDALNERIKAESRVKAAIEARKAAEGGGQSGGGLFGALKNAAGGLDAAYRGGGGGLSGMVGIFEKLASSGIAGTIAGLGLLAAGATKAVQAFMPLQSAVADLDASLAQNGLLTADYREHLQGLAQDMSNLTNVAKGKWLDAAAKLTQFGADNSNINKYMVAVKNLAGFMGGDVVGAAQMFGRAMEGQDTMLTRYGIRVDKTKTQTEQLESIMKQLGEKGGLIMEARAKTLSGEIAGLENQSGNLFQRLGGLVNQSLHLTGAFHELAMDTKFWADLLPKTIQQVDGLVNSSGNLEAAARRLGFSIKEMDDEFGQFKNMDTIGGQIEKIKTQYEQLLSLIDKKAQRDKDSNDQTLKAELEAIDNDEALRGANMTTEQQAVLHAEEEKKRGEARIRSHEREKVVRNQDFTDKEKAYLAERAITQALIKDTDDKVKKAEESSAKTGRISQDEKDKFKALTGINAADLTPEGAASASKIVSQKLDALRGQKGEYDTFGEKHKGNDFYRESSDKLGAQIKFLEDFQKHINDFSAAGADQTVAKKAQDDLKNRMTIQAEMDRNNKAMVEKYNNDVKNQDQSTAAEKVKVAKAYKENMTKADEAWMKANKEVTDDLANWINSNMQEGVVNGTSLTAKTKELAKNQANALHAQMVGFLAQMSDAPDQSSYNSAKRHLLDILRESQDKFSASVKAALEHTGVKNAPNLSTIHPELSAADQKALEGYKAHPETLPQFGGFNTKIIKSEVVDVKKLKVESLDASLKAKQLEGLVPFGEKSILPKPVHTPPQDREGYINSQKNNTQTQAASGRIVAAVDQASELLEQVVSSHEELAQTTVALSSKLQSVDKLVADMRRNLS